MIIISAVLNARPGQQDSLKRELLSMLRPVATEPGTQEYRIHQGIDDPDRFFFYEKYVDRAAVDAHMATTHFRTLLGRLDGLIAQPPEIVLHEEIGSIR